MKPIRLEIDGINSYAEKQVINFENLTSKGIFGIFGKTGSGKSTILDAITLALYGNISRGTKEFINSDRDKGRVDYEFEIGESGERSTYRVSRRFKRNKDSGNSVSDGFIRLMKKNNMGEYEVIEDGKVTEVNKKITDIIGLEESDFLRSVVLPQGKFSEFLTLNGKDRRNMLERIFSLQEYGTNLNNKLASKKKSVSEGVKILEARLGEYPDISEELRNNIEKKVKNLEEKINESEKLFKSENKILEDYTRILKLVLEKEKIDITINKLLEKKEEVEELKEKVKLGERALSVKPEVDKKYKLEETIDLINKEQEKVFEIKNAVKKELEEYSEEFKEVKNKYDSMGFVLSTKKDIESIEATKAKIKSLNETINSLILRNKDIEKSEKELNKKIENYEIDLQETNKNIENINKKIKENTVLNLFREKIDIGINYHRDIYKLDRNIESYEKEYKLNKSEIEKGLKELESLEEKKENIEKNISSITDLIIEQEKIEVLSDEEFDKLEKSISFIIKEGERIRELENRKNTFIKEKEKAEKSLGKVKKIIKENKKKEKEIEESILKLKKIDDKNNIKKLTSDIKAIWHKDFHKGDICPVCGSSVEVVDFQDNLNIEIEQSRAELEEKNKIYQEVLIETAKFETNRDTFKENILDFENKIMEIDKSIDGKSYKELSEKNEKYSSYRDSQKALFRKINNEIERLKKNKEKAESEKNEYINKIVVIKEFISGKKETIANINEKIDSLENEKKLINKSLDEVSFEIQNIVGQNEISFEQINREFYIEENEKIKEKVNLVEKLYKKLESESKKLSEVEKLKKGLVDRKNELEREKAISKNQVEITIENIKTEEKHIEDKKKSIDFERLDKIIMFEYSSIEQLPGILDSFERIVNQNYEDITRALEESKNQYNELEKRYENNNTKLKMNSDIYKEQSNVLLEKMEESGFENIEEIGLYLLSEEDLKESKKDIEVYEINLSDNLAMKKNVVDKLNGEYITEEEKNTQEEKCFIISSEIEKLKVEYSQEKYKLEDIEKKLKSVKEIVKKLKNERKLLDNIKIIDELFRGNRFVEYLSQIYLENIVIEASERLYNITNGRYTLEINDNYQFVISDNFNGGLRRSADTLSGGEVFLTSLSLALALSSQIQLKGSAPLEFFFLDEGFGTLDAELLETVMQSLEKLYSDTLSVGIISHVEEIKARIPMKLEVFMDETLSSSIIKEIEY